MPDPGRGWAHRQRAGELKAAMRDGDPCARCGGPMWREDLANIHADHYTVALVEGGQLPDALSHGPCNTSHGARLKAARARAARVTIGPPAPPPAW